MSEKEKNVNPIAVGSRIKDIRLKLGDSMTEFASRIDKKAKSGTVSNWETGKNLPNNNRLKRIAELGGVSMTYLLEGKMTFDDLPIIDQERLRREYLVGLTNINSNEYHSLINYLDDLHNNKFDTVTVSTLASVLRYCFIVEPNNVDDDPIKIRFLKYIIDQLNYFLTGEHEVNSADIILSDLIEKLEYIIRD